MIILLKVIKVEKIFLTLPITVFLFIRVPAEIYYHIKIVIFLQKPTTIKAKNCNPLPFYL